MCHCSHSQQFLKICVVSMTNPYPLDKNQIDLSQTSCSGPGHKGFQSSCCVTDMPLIKHYKVHIDGAKKMTQLVCQPIPEHENSQVTGTLKVESIVAPKQVFTLSVDLLTDSEEG